VRHLKQKIWEGLEVYGDPVKALLEPLKDDSSKKYLSRKTRFLYEQESIKRFYFSDEQNRTAKKFEQRATLNEDVFSVAFCGAYHMVEFEAVLGNKCDMRFSHTEPYAGSDIPADSDLDVEREIEIMVGERRARGLGEEDEFNDPAKPKLLVIGEKHRCNYSFLLPKILPNPKRLKKLGYKKVVIAMEHLFDYEVEEFLLGKKPSKMPPDVADWIRDYIREVEALGLEKEVIGIYVSPHSKNCDS
jgi:hypothetical protein